jgi:hypothetical protein
MPCGLEISGFETSGGEAPRGPVEQDLRNVPTPSAATSMASPALSRSGGFLN